MLVLPYSAFLCCDAIFVSVNLLLELKRFDAFEFIGGNNTYLNLFMCIQIKKLLIIVKAHSLVSINLDQKRFSSVFERNFSVPFCCLLPLLHVRTDYFSKGLNSPSLLLLRTRSQYFEGNTCFFECLQLCFLDWWGHMFRNRSSNDLLNKYSDHFSPYWF